MFITKLPVCLRLRECQYSTLPTQQTLIKANSQIENGLLKTRSTKGSIYGISSNTKFAAFLRQQNKSKEYKNLYFCGGSAHPGGGIPLVLLSGKIVSELINKYES